MQECVDKQECDELRVRKVVVRSLGLGYLKADDDLTALGIRGIREHVRNVALLSEALVKTLSLGWSNKRKRHFP